MSNSDLSVRALLPLTALIFTSVFSCLHLKILLPKNINKLSYLLYPTVYKKFQSYNNNININSKTTGLNLHFLCSSSYL